MRSDGITIVILIFIIITIIIMDLPNVAFAVSGILYDDDGE